MAPGLLGSWMAFSLSALLLSQAVPQVPLPSPLGGPHPEE